MPRVSLEKFCEKKNVNLENWLKDQYDFASNGEVSMSNFNETLKYYRFPLKGPEVMKLTRKYQVTNTTNINYQKLCEDVSKSRSPESAQDLQRRVTDKYEKDDDEQIQTQKTVFEKTTGMIKGKKTDN